MPDDPDSRPDRGRPSGYRIRVSGHLDDRWADSLEGLTVTREASGETVLTVPVVDQAALHGLLRKLRDLGAPLVSINPTRFDLPGIASREEKER
jgi:hypothetical protein